MIKSKPASMRQAPVSRLGLAQAGVSAREKGCRACAGLVVGANRLALGSLLVTFSVAINAGRSGS
jgi:hypothetical protein